MLHKILIDNKCTWYLCKIKQLKYFRIIILSCLCKNISKSCVLVSMTPIKEKYLLQKLLYHQNVLFSLFTCSHFVITDIYIPFCHHNLHYTTSWSKNTQNTDVPTSSALLLNFLKKLFCCSCLKNMLRVVAKNKSYRIPWMVSCEIINNIEIHKKSLYHNDLDCS